MSSRNEDGCARMISRIMVFDEDKDKKTKNIHALIDYGDNKLRDNYCVHGQKQIIIQSVEARRGGQRWE